MPLVKRQPSRWMDPVEVVWLLGMPKLRGDETEDEIARAVSRAIDVLGKMHKKWGIEAVSRDGRPGSRKAYIRMSVYEYMARREGLTVEELTAEMSQKARPRLAAVR